MLKDDLVFKLNKDLNVDDGFVIPKGTYGVIYMAYPTLSLGSSKLYRDKANAGCILLEGFPINVKEADMDFNLSSDDINEVIERFVDQAGYGLPIEDRLETEARLRVTNKKEK